MANGACHVCHYRSTVDDSEQPYVVSVSRSLSPTMPTACVLWLHDALGPPTREQFLESALDTAHRWQPAIEQSRSPVIFVQPFGRGNAPWIGPAGRDLIDVLDSVSSEYSIESGQTVLVGLGSGATGALQLAAWFPDRWRAVAACGPVVDERIGTPVATPVWEAAARESVRIASLASNLASTPIWLEHPWWADGLYGSAHPDQLECLAKLLSRVDGRFHIARDRPVLATSEAWPTEPSLLLNWLLEHSTADALDKWQHTTLSPRSWQRSVRSERLEAEGKPAQLRVDEKPDEIRIRTKGIAEIAVRVEPSKSVKIDRNRFSIPMRKQAPDDFAWTRFEKLGDSWSLVSDQNGFGEFPGRSSVLPGPVADMRWDGVAFVPGSLGDDFENRTMFRLAETIRKKWIDGSDAPRLHPADATTLVDYPIVLDSDVTADMASRKHLVVIGTPRTNLLLARFRGELGCTWPITNKSGDGPEAFRVAGKLYNGPRDGLFLLGPNPEFPDRYLYLITATTVEGLATAASFPTAFMPDYLVYRQSEVRVWGHCNADWRP